MRRNELRMFLDTSKHIAFRIGPWVLRETAGPLYQITNSMGKGSLVFKDKDEAITAFEWIAR